MKFNLMKIGNRDYVDMGDLTTCLYNLSLTKNKMDRSTLATVISAVAYIASKFAEKQPKEQSVYIVNITDGIFNKEIKRVLKENKKRLAKHENIDYVVVDEETYQEEKMFTNQQLDQLQKMLASQNIELQKLFETAVSKIKINVTAPEAPAPKKKTSA